MQLIIAIDPPAYNIVCNVLKRNLNVDVHYYLHDKINHTVYAYCETEDEETQKLLLNKKVSIKGINGIFIKF